MGFAAQVGFSFHHQLIGRKKHGFLENVAAKNHKKDAPPMRVFGCFCYEKKGMSWENKDKQKLGMKKAKKKRRYHFKGLVQGIYRKR